MGLLVKFGGVDLSEYISVLEGFTPFSGADWKTSVLSDGTKRGADFEYQTYKYKTIPMPFDMSGDLVDKYDKLCLALNRSEPMELYFGSVPDRVFYAIATGDFDFEQINKFGSGTITWLIPDGLAHSISEKEFVAEANSDGILEATIVNEGTESVPIDYEIIHNHENGYIGIISEYGAMQFGHIGEVDAEEQSSETLFEYNADEILANMASGGTFSSSYTNNGALTVNEHNGVRYLELTNAGSGTGWHGAGRYKDFPADSSGNTGSKNWKVESKIWYQSTKATQTGAMDLCVTKGTQVIASMQIWDGDTGSNLTNVDMYVGSSRVARYQFNADGNSWSGSGGKVYIQKTDELFEFGYGTTKFQVNMDEYEDIIADRVQIFISQKGSRGYADMPWVCFESLSVRADGSGEVPNRYPAGSVVTIDGETGKFYVDGVPMLGDEIVGTRYFLAPPGETKVQFVYSEFSDPAPTIKAKIREAYL